MHFININIKRNVVPTEILSCKRAMKSNNYYNENFESKTGLLVSRMISVLHRVRFISSGTTEILRKNKIIMMKMNELGNL